MSQSGKAPKNQYAYLPQQLMYELLYMLHIRIGGIPDSGYHFHLIPNLKEKLLEAGYGLALWERVKNLDFRGEEYLRDLLSDIDKLQKFVNLQ